MALRGRISNKMKVGDLVVVNTFVHPAEGMDCLAIVLEKDNRDMMTRVLLSSGRKEWYWESELAVID